MNLPRDRSRAPLLLVCRCRTLLVACLALMLGSPAFSQQVSSIAGTPQAHSQLPVQIANRTATMAGHYTASPKLRLTLALQPPHLQEEERFLVELTDRKSPNFHRFLTAEQWNARFAPSAQEEQSIVDWATSNGFTVTHRYANRLLVDVEAPVSTVESAFGVSINNYRLGQELDFSNDREPVIPANIAHLLVSVQGLNNIQRMHSSRVGATDVRGADYQDGPVLQTGQTIRRDGDAAKANQATAAKAAASRITPDVTNNAYDPSDLYSSEAYDYAALQNLGHCCNPAHAGDGSPAASSIAIAAFQDYTSSDLLGFAGQYNLALNVDRFYVDGNPGCCGSEVTADVEFSAAMANSFGSYLDTAHIWVYEGGNSNNSTFTDLYNQMLNDGKARVFTTSWSCTEFYQCDGGTMDSRHNIFNQMIGQGWTLMAASGDRGATDNCSNDIAVAYPGSDPDLISVGGTTLQAAGSYTSETAWQGGTGTGSCGGNNGGSGGGCSAKFAAPGYQSSPLCGSGSRSVPDIALNSSINENFFYNGSLHTFAGTSMASPELAGFFAQSNAYLLSINTGCGAGYASPCAPVGNGNYYLYQEGNNPNYAPHYPFYDITSGCNSNDISALYGLNAFCAQTGYDAVTGWGSANMLQLAWSIGTYLAWDGGAPALEFFGPPTTGWTNNAGSNVGFNVYDTANYGYPSTGIAGYSAQWDEDPGDPSRESTPGTGNSFYSGPQVANSTTGSLPLSAVSQGCHTAFVRAWDNTGINSGAQTYGQVCLDTVAPSLNDSNAPAPNPYGWNNSPITVSLLASDSGAGSGHGSGVATVFYGLDATCTPTNTRGCSVYTGSLRVATQGHHTLYSFARDNAGNNSTLQVTFPSVDETAPVTSLALSGTGKGTAYTSAVRLTFSAADPLSGTQLIQYSLDGAPFASYTGSLAVSAPGHHTVTYRSKDNAGNLEAAKSQSFTITSPTTTTLTSSRNPSDSGQGVTLIATVVPALSGMPAGNVVFKRGATVLATKPLSAGRAAFAISNLPVGVDTLTATYEGAAYDLPSSGSLTETVRGTTSTSLTSSLISSSFWQPVILAATVKAGAPPLPTGSVQFLDGSHILGTAPLIGGKANLSLSSLPVGTHHIEAKYTGNSTSLASTSTALTHTVTAATTATTLASNLNPAVWDKPVTFSATIKPAFPGTVTGTVTFKSGSSTLATIAVSNNRALFTTSSLAPGKSAIVAIYNGTPDFKASESPALSESVLQATTKVALVSSANHSTYKEAVRFTAKVTSSTPAPPRGSVSFRSGSAVLGSAVLSNGVAALTTTTLPAGNHTITAVYSGSVDDVASTSAALLQKVSPAPTVTTLRSSPNPSTRGQKVTVSLTVTSKVATPAGKVSLLEDGRVLASLTLSNGSATFSTSALAEGTHSLQADFATSGDFAASTSTVLRQTVK